MVKFGERLREMQHAGWERHYVRYNDLKLIIDKIDSCATDDDHQAMSNQFLSSLGEDIKGVDAFVKEQTDQLRDQTELTDAASLRSAQSSLKVLRRFVGTNVIAATKIAKKHDKHVQPSMRKRTVVGNMIRSSQAFGELIAFSSKVEEGLQREKNKLSPKLVPTKGPITEEEAGLRSLPDWLLSSASVDDARSEGSEEELPSSITAWHYPTFFSTYLDDWRVPPQEELHGLVSRVPATDKVGADGDGFTVDFKDNSVPWAQLSTSQRLKLLAIILVKLCFIVGALYFFICSLSFLADGFRLVGGKKAGEVFRNSEVFNNPVAGMLVGVLVTVLVQSSSTSTSIFITMVAAELLTVTQAIPLVMGANIGTSVTSTIVALGQSGDRNEFRRAFAAATVHDMFNFMCVIVLLPLEAITGYLYRLSKALIDATPGLKSGEKPPDILKALTKPFTSKIIKLDKGLIKDIATAETEAEFAALEGESMLKHLFGNKDVGASDTLVGVLVLIVALLILCVTLFTIVYLLKSILKGQIAVWLHRSVNGQVPDIKCGEHVRIPMGWASGYLAMLVGLGLTICVQSSSITTSALTPLVGVGVLQVERMYPTVLGANIGTCITGVLAALAADGSKLFLTLQVAYAHLFFNLTGIIIWYGIWPLRSVPIGAAKFLGNTTATYRWFALVYLAVCFFIVPAIFMGFSLAGDVPLGILIALTVLVAVFVTTVNVLQARRPQWLPAKLRSWDWLPEPMRSLRPYDVHVFGPLSRVCSCCLKSSKMKSVDLKNIQMAKVAELAPTNDELAVAAERM
jgi:sodium-dependent phosphate cotransporter